MSVIAEAMKLFVNHRGRQLREAAARKQGEVFDKKLLPKALSSVEGDLGDFENSAEKTKKGVADLISLIGGIEAEIGETGELKRSDITKVEAAVDVIGDHARTAFGKFGSARETMRDLAATYDIPFTRTGAQKQVRGLPVAPRKKEPLASRLAGQQTAQIALETKQLAVDLQRTFKDLIDLAERSRRNVSAMKQRVSMGHDVGEDMAEFVNLFLDMRDAFSSNLFGMLGAIEGRVQEMKKRVGRERRLALASESTGIKKLVDGVRLLVEQVEAPYSDVPEEGAVVTADTPADAIQLVLGVLTSLDQSGVWEAGSFDDLIDEVHGLLDDELDDEDYDALMDDLADLAGELEDEDMLDDAIVLGDAVLAIDEFYTGEDEEEDYEDEDYEAEVGDEYEETVDEAAGDAEKHPGEKMVFGTWQKVGAASEPKNYGDQRGDRRSPSRKRADEKKKAASAVKAAAKKAKKAAERAKELEAQDDEEEIDRELEKEQQQKKDAERYELDDDDDED